MILKSAEEVRQVRNDLGISIFEAIKIVENKNLLNFIENASTLDEIKEILIYIVKNRL